MWIKGANDSIQVNTDHLGIIQIRRKVALTPDPKDDTFFVEGTWNELDDDFDAQRVNLSKEFDTHEEAQEYFSKLMMIIRRGDL